MTHVWILLSGFFVANFFWLITVLNSTYSETVTPKYISSSYDPNKNQELESILLKSFQKYINKYFNTKPNEAKTISSNEEKRNITDSITETNYEPIKITNSSKLSMFLDNEKKFIYIVKVSNERESPHRFDNKVGEVTLYYIPVHNFILNPNEKSLPDHSLIRKCWSSKFYGRIIGAVSSSDKLNLGVFYRLVKGPNINYRIRYFHNISCDNYEIENTDEHLNKKYIDYLKISKSVQIMAKGVSEPENYFEITDGMSSTECNSQKKHFENFFNDLSYDDFQLKGNTPITSMAIKKNVIAYSRDFDYRQFYIIKREKIIKNDEKNILRSWKVSLLGPQIDKNIHNFFHTNSLKFANDKVNDYKLFHVYVTMNTSGINTYGYVVKANDTDYTEMSMSSNNTNNLLSSNSSDKNEPFLNYSVRKVARYSIENEILDINNYEDFNLENSIQRLKRYIKPTVYSNSNHHNNLVFEFKKGTVCIMGWSKKSNKEYFYNLTPDGQEKVSKISSDANNENIIIKFENSNEMLYFFRYKDKQDKQNLYYDVTKNINFKNIPKKYREKEILVYFIEKIGDKTYFNFF